MAKYCGKGLLLQVETSSGSGTYTSIGALRETGITVGNEQVDVTDKAGAPSRELLNCGLRTYTISASGPMSDDAMLTILRARANDGDLYNFRVISDSGTIYTGLFQVASLERTGTYNNVEEWSVTLESGGAITVTP
jgi:predicted secreted protein